MGAQHINGFSTSGAATPLEGLQLSSGQSVTVEGQEPGLPAFKVSSISFHNALKRYNSWKSGEFGKNITVDI